MFDKRGTGLSDPIPTSTLPTLEEFMTDIPAVLDTVGSERAALISNIGGGILAMPFAATHPERVSSLILVDCFARFLEAPDFPIGAPVADLAPARDRGRRHRSRGDDRPVRTIRHRATSVSAASWAKYERSAATPGSTKAIVRLIYESDVRDILLRSVSRRWSSTAGCSRFRSSTGATSPSAFPVPGTSSCRAPTTSSGQAIRTRSSQRSRSS